MSVVLDANLLVVLALDNERAPLVEAKMREWATAVETLHAPALLPYEAANALVRAAVAGGLEPGIVAEIWATISAVPITLHPLEAGVEVIAIAQRLGRQSAYYAAYIGLAQSLDADLWTLDRPLARNARSIGCRYSSSGHTAARPEPTAARVGTIGFRRIGAVAGILRLAAGSPGMQQSRVARRSLVLRNEREHVG